MKNTSAIKTLHELSEKLIRVSEQNRILSLERAILISRLREENARNRELIFATTHEVRTPLTLLRGQFETNLARADFTPEMKKNYRNALAEVNLIEKFMRDLLSITELKSEEKVLKFRKTNISSLLAAVIQKKLGKINAHSAAKKTKFEIISEIEPKVELLADREKLAIVFGEIIGNAKKYSSNGGKIYISLKKQNNKIIFTVADEGIGISERELKKIFSHFYRTSTAKKTGKIGTGLGLAIVKEILTLHSGEIMVKSKLGKGSTFQITFQNDKK